MCELLSFISQALGQLVISAGRNRCAYLWLLGQALCTSLYPQGSPAWVASIKMMPRGERTASPQQHACIERSENSSNTIKTPNKTLSPEQMQRQKQNVFSRKETVLGIKGCGSKLRHNSSQINKETIYRCLETRDDPWTPLCFRSASPGNHSHARWGFGRVP